MKTRRYEVVHPLAPGGLGSVYRARPTGGPAPDVAIEVLPAGALEGDVEALRTRARVARRLDHRAIARVEGVVQVSGRSALVLEYVDGVDLLRIRRRLLRLPLSVVCGVVEEVASALASALRATGAEGEPLHVVHRDLRPANVMVTRTGGVRVLRFGAPPPARPDLAAEYRAPVHLAPECLAGAPQDERADVYALGAMAAELLLGAPIPRNVPGATPTPRSPVPPKLAQTHPPLGALVDLLLSQVPEERPSADEIARRCALLRGPCGEPNLPAWAEREVVPILDAMLEYLGAQPADLVGQGFDMEGPALPPPRPEPETEPMNLPPLGTPVSAPPRHTDDEPTMKEMPAELGLARPEPPAATSEPQTLSDYTPVDEPDVPLLQFEDDADTAPTEIGRGRAPPRPARLSPPPAPPATPRSQGLFPALLAAALVGVSGIGVIGVVLALFVFDQATTAGPAPPTPLAAPAAEPEPPPEPVPPPEPEPEPLPEPVPEVVPAPAPAPPPVAKPSPAPRPPTPRPDAPRPAGSKATVTVGGDAKRVRLSGGGRTVDVPGKVPAGEYTIEASFDGGTFRAAGRVVLSPGQAVQVYCKSSFEVCKAE